MDWKLFATVFASVFIAEMADKTQIVTLLFAANAEVSRWLVFTAAALALVLTTAIGVAAGTLAAELINPRWMSVVAGAGFVLIGCWTLYRGLAPA